MKLKEGEYTMNVRRMADLVTPMAIRVAATLRVADHIAAGLCTAAQMAAAESVDTDALDRVLRQLATAKILQRKDSGVYSLTPRGEWLRSWHPSCLRDELDITGALGRAELSFVHLLESVRTGGAAFPKLYGRGFWDGLATDPARRDAYDARMGVDVAAWAVDVVPAYDWGALRHVVDVGGGNGTLVAALLDAYPTLRGTVFDQPHTVAAAEATVQAAGLSNRCDVASGSFFDALPAGAGGYILSAVLHDWDDEAARTILRRCADAAGPAGRVFVIEKTGRGGESPRTHMDLRMLAYFGGRERGVGALSALAADVGLGTVAVHPAGDLSILELTAI